MLECEEYTQSGIRKPPNNYTSSWPRGHKAKNVMIKKNISKKKAKKILSKPRINLFQEVRQQATVSDLNPLMSVFMLKPKLL